MHRSIPHLSIQPPVRPHIDDRDIVARKAEGRYVLIAKKDSALGGVEPSLDGKDSSGVNQIVRQTHKIIHPIEAKCLADYASGERCTALEYAVVAADDVVGVPVPRPPTDQAGWRWQAPDYNQSKTLRRVRGNAVAGGDRDRVPSRSPRARRAA